jgi:voltage-gated potassium channel
MSAIALAKEEGLRRFARASEWPLALLALAIIPSLLLEDRTPEFHAWSDRLNWVVWLAFCGELVIKARLSHDVRGFLRHSWFDLIIVLFSPPFAGPEYLQGLRAFRAVRLLRFLRVLRVLAVAGIALESARDALQHRKFHYVVLVTVVTLGLGSLAIYAAEHDHNPTIRTVGDAVWWSIVTATTVGYGDISPTTVEGRLIAVALMLVGIGFISIFTATVASFFLDQSKQEQGGELGQIHARLMKIENKQDELLELVQHRQTRPIDL